METPTVARWHDHGDPAMTSLSHHVEMIAGPGKTCSKCHKWLPISHYYAVRRDGEHKGWRADCKLCFKKSRVVRWAGLGEVTSPSDHTEETR